MRSALSSLLRKRQGQIAEGASSSGLETEGAARARSSLRLRAYEAVCGFRVRPDRVPPTYPEILFLPLMTKLALAAEFPVSPLGLIHVGQSITQHRPVRRDARLELRCALERATPTEKGIELEIALVAREHGDVLWEGRTFVLSRAAHLRSARRYPRKEEPRGRSRGPAVPADPVLEPAEHVVEIPARTGLLYAAVSADFNPHHLFTWTARPLGYRRPIAHGMWTLARALAWLDEESPLEDAISIEARFKRPLSMPGTMAFRMQRSADATELDLRDGATQEPLLICRVSPIPADVAARD